MDTSCDMRHGAWIRSNCLREDFHEEFTVTYNCVIVSAYFYHLCEQNLWREAIPLSKFLHWDCIFISLFVSFLVFGSALD